MNDTTETPAGTATSNAAWSVVNHMIAGILVYGGLGWMVGLWLGYPQQGLAVGVVCGLAASTYLVVFRLRQLDGPPAASADDVERSA